MRLPTNKTRPRRVMPCNSEMSESALKLRFKTRRFGKAMPKVLGRVSKAHEAMSRYCRLGTPVGGARRAGDRRLDDRYSFRREAAAPRSRWMRGSWAITD